MTGCVSAQFLRNSAQISDFLQIAVLLIFSTLYQPIIKSVFWIGNELVTVLLTGFYVGLHLTE